MPAGRSGFKGSALPARQPTRTMDERNNRSLRRVVAREPEE
jgi:hypothetical protein